MHYIPFNSRNKLHKEKFGAMGEGETTYFRVVLPRRLQCSGVTLVIHRDDNYEFEYIPFEWDGMQGDNEEWWKASYTTKQAGLYWYRFEYMTPWGKCQITNVGNSVGSLSPNGEDWQLTVYDRSFKTPEWIKGGIIYQIFPDRFNFSGEEKTDVPKDRVLRSDRGCPEFRPIDGIVKNNDFFCGDLKGIEQKLDYLKALGVSCIYLNPIFEAHSNHRYDTADYMNIDPLLGEEKDFENLIKEAEKLGIKIILDGVFSHTGADSKYFNKNNRYKEIGAYNSKNSEYYSWYKFVNYPDKYDCWWGIKILPEVNESDKGFLEYVLGENGVVEKWLSKGICGWRLDVADELPDIFLDKLRKTVKSKNSDAIIIGEVWEDASNKYSYSSRRRYLLGDQLDSVMNYPFAKTIMDFVRQGKAEGFHDKILTVLENYPKQVVDSLMNHIGTHDTARAITVLAGENGDFKDKEWQSRQSLTSEQRAKGIKLMKIASAIQYTLPGVPSVYYGDEAGMEGYSDPFNRRFYPWGEENTELLDWYKLLGGIRHESKALKDGEYKAVSDILGAVAYIREAEGEKLMLIANRNEEEITYYMPPEMHSGKVLCGGEDVGNGNVRIPPLSAIIVRLQERI